MPIVILWKPFLNVTGISYQARNLISLSPQKYNSNAVLEGYIGCDFFFLLGGAEENISREN